jgi:2-polyprenyl-3-methyl-5-hydroxy-6-metoxy-1,4-benzoquinol methylase
MTTHNHDIDEAKAEAFAGQMVDILNGAAVALMVSVGHQTGLYDVMADLPPSTSEQIAEAAGLNERYVREWLGAMVTGKVVVYDPDATTYSLPPEHAAWLTREAGASNLAVQAQYIPILAQVEQQIIECFRNGGGVPYSAFPRFHTVMAEDSAVVQDTVLIDHTLDLIPGLVEQLTAGIDVADIGCGSGHALNLMAETFPNSRFTGYDFSEEAVGVAQRETQEKGLKNAGFKVRDVTRLGEQSRFDLITAFDAIHDQGQPAAVLSGIHKALRPRGIFLMADIAASSNVHENMDHMIGPFLYTISSMHCMTVSLAQDGMGLGAVWGEQRAREMLADAGFAELEVKQNEGDIFNNYFIARKQP